MRITEYEDRMAICEQCEFLKKPLMQCGACGCFLIVKARVAGLDCPHHKWTIPDNNDGC